MGYYQANEHLQDSGKVSDSGFKVADLIKQHSEGEVGCMLLLDNERIAQLPSGAALKPYSWDKQKKDWTLHGPEALATDDSAGRVVVEAFQADRQLEVVDFDDHLEDVSLDWFNEELSNSLVGAV